MTRIEIKTEIVNFINGLCINVLYLSNQKALFYFTISKKWYLCKHQNKIATEYWTLNSLNKDELIDIAKDLGTVYMNKKEKPKTSKEIAANATKILESSRASSEMKSIFASDLKERKILMSNQHMTKERLEQQLKAIRWTLQQDWTDGHQWMTIKEIIEQVYEEEVE